MTSENSSVFSNTVDKARQIDKKILIIEDDDEFVHDVEAIARSLGDATLAWDRASSVREGLLLLGNEDTKLPDVAIVDVGLVGESGLDFVREVRRRNYLFPIIVISSSEIDDITYKGKIISRYQMIELGATEFQTKTVIGNSQTNFLKFVISISDQFEQLLSKADRPDRLFHSSVSYDSISDLRNALSICKSSKKGESAEIWNEKSDDNKKDLLIFYIERVIEKEKLRIQYTLNLSVRDKIRAFTYSASDAAAPSLKVQAKFSPLSRILYSFSRFWNPFMPTRLNRPTFK